MTSSFAEEEESEDLFEEMPWLPLPAGSDAQNRIGGRYRRLCFAGVGEAG